MVLPSRVAAFANRVKKTTGGRAWLPKWGLTGLSPTQKANRRKNVAEEHGIMSSLKQAAENEPARAVRAQK
ncbi:hypothetical protein H632_c4010p0 [Helicosporidium sp. ATCC 50920]|nr:hypothetical protein H632_c4010p0 [Helicosporidium sp. ATCC 50920]|eukprot:KDD72008.1 hypothetical protein H632_c4010p0 [Helicosporidium sp. ATCC 50920]